MRESKIKIQKMSAAHVAGAAAIEAGLFSMPWTQAALGDAVSQASALFYVAMLDNEVAGYCGLYYAADEGEVAKVAVAPHCQRRNIAQMLLLEALRELCDRGVRHVYLEVRESNIPAIRLYEKIGFQKSGIRKGYYCKPDEDALVMKYTYADI